MAVKLSAPMIRALRWLSKHGDLGRVMTRDGLAYMGAGDQFKVRVETVDALIWRGMAARFGRDRIQITAAGQAFLATSPDPSQEPKPTPPRSEP